MSQTLYALVDCHSFYCSCERVFQPKFKNKPVVVLSNNDGCIVSRSDEAKALGIAMAAPYHQIKEFCQKNKVGVFSSNYPLYGDMSRRVMNTLEEFTTHMEVYSIDEAFLKVKSAKKDDLYSWAVQIRNTVLQNTGIPVGVGIGATRTLAKLANHLAKKNHKKQSVYVLDSESDLAGEMSQVSVSDIWGIGRQSSSKLQEQNIFTAEDLRQASPQLIQKILTINGRKTQDELNGISRIELDDMQSKKNILSSRSFGKKVTDFHELKEAAAFHASHVAEKLRAQNSIAGSITVFIRTNRFSSQPQYYNSATLPLFSGTSSTPKIIKSAHVLLRQIYKKGYEYQKIGIILSDLERRSLAQLDLFSTYDSVKEDQLMKVIDQINAKNGRKTLMFASEGVQKKWQMRQALKSPQYTTSWDDLLEIKI